MNGLIDHLRMDINAKSTVVFPITVTNAIYIGDNTSGKTLDSFISRHSHNMADIVDLNTDSDGNVIFNKLTLLLNGNIALTYNGVDQASLDISLSSLGAAAAAHNHDTVYSKVNHTHSNYAPLVHTHTVSDISDFSGGGGDGTLNGALTIQVNGFTQVRYNGSANQSIDITVDNIGAAPASHTHSISGISDMGALTISTAGGTTVEYTPNAAKTLEINAEAVGAAAISHNHDLFYSLIGHSHDGFYAPTNHLHRTFDTLPPQISTGYIATGLESSATLGAKATSEGSDTEATGEASHAEGYRTIASGECSHAEGERTTASKDCSHAEGYSTTASGGYSHAEGYRTTASGGSSHAEGYLTTASGSSSHTEGDETTASGTRSHAEGYLTTASGWGSHAEGSETIASGDYSHASGISTLSEGANSFAIGRFNKQYNTSPASVGSYDFVIGNGGGPDSRRNCFRIQDGAVYANRGYNSSGADYAEYFEWLDGNPNNEDRVGLFVTLVGDKIAIANSNSDFIIGAISGMASVIGNAHDDQWCNMHQKDEFGRFKMEYVEKRDADGNIIICGDMAVLNPDYDNTKEYIPRSERPEWDAVGMLGVLIVRDDGSCQVNSYCKVSAGGIVTASDKGYRVLQRIRDDVIKILFRGEAT